MPVKSHIDNKKLAKNTLYMYLRMFMILGVALFAARVVIRSLGIDDYGIYNIVGGVVVLFSFVNNTLRSAIQRFISFELGKDDIDEANKVIGSSFVIVGIFTIILLLLSETVGLWFVYNKLVIPPESLNAALCVYQFSIGTFIINMFQTPYQATIISHERMSFYAWYSIAEVILKLLVAYLIAISETHRLVIYSGLICVVSLISLLITAVYCHRNLSVPLTFNGSRDIMKPIFSYSGWGMMNSSTVIASQQGGNILLNLFVGVTANGAFGIANQVTAAINGFVSNFQSAFNPQITKSYSAGENTSLFTLVNRTSVLSFCLLAIIAVPFFIECEYIMTLWLGECPEYVVGFCNLMLAYFLIDAPQAPLWMLIYATGQIKVYQIWTGVVTLLNVPIAFLMLKLGYSAYWVFIIRVLLNGITALIRPFYLHYIMNEFSLPIFFKEAIFPVLKITLICSIIVIMGIYVRSELNAFIIILSSFLLATVLIIQFGISSQDRKIIIELVMKKMRRKIEQS